MEIWEYNGIYQLNIYIYISIGIWECMNIFLWTVLNIWEYVSININGIISSRFQHVKVAGDFKGPVSPNSPMVWMVWRDGLGWFGRTSLW